MIMPVLLDKNVLTCQIMEYFQKHI